MYGRNTLHFFQLSRRFIKTHHCFFVMSPVSAFGPRSGLAWFSFVFVAMPLFDIIAGFVSTVDTSSSLCVHADGSQSSHVQSNANPNAPVPTTQPDGNYPTYVVINGFIYPKADHGDWPVRNGVLQMNKTDIQNWQSLGGDLNDELLGGHKNDNIKGGKGNDVIWGDYKPNNNDTKAARRQFDRLSGGAGNDHIYASHGKNRISAGSGNDTIHAHFGRGSINCGPGHDTVYMSHKGRAGYKLIGCEKIDYRPEAKRISKPRPTPTAAAASLRSPTRTSPRTSRTRKSKHSAKKYH